MKGTAQYTEQLI